MTFVQSSRFQFGTALSKSFEVMFQNIVPFGIIAMLMTLPLMLINLYLYDTIFDMQQAVQDPSVLSDPAASDAYLESLKWTFGYSILTWIIYAFAATLGTAAMCYGTYESLRGHKPSLGQCLRKGLPLLIPALVISILMLVALSLSAIALFVPAVILAMVWYVVIPVTIVERPGIFAAFGRSAELTRGNRWRLFGVFLVTIAIGWALGLPAGIASLIFYGNAGVLSVLSWITTAASLIFNAVVIAVVYFYLRAAREGGSIEDIAAVFD